MRIGIDARPLVGNKSGIGHYLEEILNVWAKKDTENDFYLFAHTDFELRTSNRNMKKIVLPGRLGTLWIQYAVPYLLSKYKIDLFWGPNYSIPLIHSTSTKLVTTIHDMVAFLYPETLSTKTALHNLFGLPFYVNNANRIITVSESSKKDIIKFLDYPSSKIDVTLLGVNDSFFPTTINLADKLKRYEIQSPYILCVGTIEPRKNLINVIKAYAKLVEEHSVKQRLVIVGAKGWKYSAINDILKERIDLLDRVSFLGYVPAEDLPAIYQGASVLVYPSIYEGFGLPPLEAMASGIPVITSNTSSLPEVVGDAGLLINPHSIEELGQAIIRVLNEQDLRIRLSRAGVERAKMLIWEKTAEQTMGIFREVMNEGLQ